MTGFFQKNGAKLSPPPDKSPPEQKWSSSQSCFRINQSSFSRDEKCKISIPKTVAGQGQNLREKGDGKNYKTVISSVWRSA
jgi:hypothetical protein